MTAQLSPTPVFKAFDNNGLPLAFGQLFSYAAGTTTPQPTYVDSTLTTPNPNPVLLNFRGECPLWLDPTLSYKFDLFDQNGNHIPGWPVDNIIGNAVGLFSDGTVGAPSISFASDPQTGLYKAPGAALGQDAIGFSTGGYAVARVSGANNTPTEFDLNAAGGQSATYTVNGNGVAPFQGSIIQQNGSGNLKIKNLTATGFTTIGAGGNEQLAILANGTVTINGAPINPTSGSFTATFTGFTTTVTGTVNYYSIGPVVTVLIPQFIATSNSAQFTMTGVPSAIVPPTVAQSCTISQDAVENAGAAAASRVSIGTGIAPGGTMTIFLAGSNVGWTATGIKGFSTATAFSYFLI